MLRLLHTADVHLGARYADLGPQAIAQHERQFAAFRASIDLALEEHVDLFLIAGDLFDSNTQPRRSAEKVAAELKRLADARIRTVIAPGTHDVYDRSSVYRAYDLVTMAGQPRDTELITILTPDRSEVALPSIDAVVFGRVFGTKRAPQSPLAGFDVSGETRATWKIGVLHAAVLIPGVVERDEVLITPDEIAASGLDYLALGHWHSATSARSGAVRYAYSGAPEPIALDQDAAGKVLLVTLDVQEGKRRIDVEERQVGRTHFQRLDVDAATIRSQAALIEQLLERRDPDLVVDVRLTGVRPDELDVDPDEVEAGLAGGFLRARVRDRSVPALTSGPLPSPDTIAGAFIRDLEGRIAELEATGNDEATNHAAELRDSLRVGRLLLGGHEVVL
ncbi:MAG TPA: DNA repair exonuclease [Candidatus Limnocylindrales bacterium]